MLIDQRKECGTNKPLELLHIWKMSVVHLAAEECESDTVGVAAKQNPKLQNDQRNLKLNFGGQGIRSSE